MVPGDDEVERPRGRLGRRRGRRSGGDASGAAGRARVAWSDLVGRSTVRRGGGQLLVMDGPADSAGICSLRALTQVLVAALDLDRLDPSAPPSPSVDDLAATLELYRWGDGYAEYPGTDAVSSEHNAGVVLAALQAHDQLRPRPDDSIWLHRAKRTFAVVDAGPTKAGLATRLHALTGIERFASIAAAEPRSASDPGRLLDDLAREDRLWERPPADNATLFGDLLLAHATEPQPRVLAELDRYLERVWREARDPSTGQFTVGGIGRSVGVGPTLDHAAVVALLARQARPA